MLHQIAWLAVVTILGVLEQDYPGCVTVVLAFLFLTFRQQLQRSVPERTEISQCTYFAMQVIYARRRCKVSPPGISGPPEFERIFRAQVNCAEYFPIFLSVLWVAGVFFHQASAAFCGLIYLYARYQYFRGYTSAAQGRLGPMYFSSGVLCVLIGLSVMGLFVHFMPLTFLIP